MWARRGSCWSWGRGGRKVVRRINKLWVRSSCADEGGGVVRSGQGGRRGACRINKLRVRSSSSDGDGREWEDAAGGTGEAEHGDAGGVAAEVECRVVPADEAGGSERGIAGGAPRRRRETEPELSRGSHHGGSVGRGGDEADGVIE